jgi:hypothetical protein
MVSADFFAATSTHGGARATRDDATLFRDPVRAIAGEIGGLQDVKPPFTIHRMILSLPFATKSARTESRRSL